MIHLDGVLISDELKEVLFCCDLAACKGACCVEGDAGAPLEVEEISLLEDHIEEIKSFMTTGGVEEVEREGVFDYDSEGNIVTPLINGKECAFICFDQDIARCAIEQAFQQQKISFPKPLSCHLYPVRISEINDGEAVNYHRWQLCSKALEKGHHEQLPLYLFLQDALTRKFGRGWYNKLLKLIR